MGNHIIYVVGEKLLRSVGSSVLIHKFHISRPAVNGRNRRFAIARPFKVLGVSPTPFPGVVEIKNSRHITLSHFGKQVVEPGQNSIIIHARGNLEGRFYLSSNVPATIRTDKDTEVIDTNTSQEVELLMETFAVTAFALGTQNGAVPEVSPYIIVRLAVLYELTVPDMDKGHRLPFIGTGEKTKACHKKEQRKNVFIHGLKGLNSYDTKLV
jgi:hypothetical protein